MTTISKKRKARDGWRRIDPRPWGKCAARWEHVDGWKLSHCGHPTALHPWELRAPDGVMVLTGVMNGGAWYHGTAWNTLDDAMQWVATHSWVRHRSVVRA